MVRWLSWVVARLKYLRPSFISKNPHFNFVSAHYIWIFSLAIIGSILIYGAGNGDVEYIDALFFASGASTQAGLNTIDFNKLNTFQQIVCYLIPMMANPIAINSFVVFLRLYWFEKRFQSVVSEARIRRASMSKAKTRPRDDVGDVERGVNKGDIRVMRGGQSPRMANDGMILGNNTTVENDGSDATAVNVDRDSVDVTANGQPDTRRSGITFAPTVKRSDGLSDDAIKFPPARSDGDHLAILERQREDGETLRIPGPRDAERGLRPQRVERIDDGDNITLLATRSYPPETRPPAITIEEPERRQYETKDSSTNSATGDARAIAGALSFLRPRIPRWMSKRNQQLHNDADAAHNPMQPQRRGTLHALRTAISGDKEVAPYLSWEPTIGRNSAFPDLTEEQREELGGIEYRSLKTLALVLTWYFWGFSALGVVCLVPWILTVDRWGEIVDAAAQSRTWWGFFTANSAFMDLGFTLTPDSMNSFNTAVFPLLLMSFLIVIGNTGFPVMLRFIIWVTSLFTPRGTGLYEELRFLLDHPRRCFTLLFPSGATWWLFWLLIILNGLDVIFFIVLDLGTGPVTEMPGGIKVLDGLFEAASTRTAGFSCVNLALLHPGVQVSYMIMMYISVFPIAISVRRTNVYEERSLGIYGGGDDIDEQAHGSDRSYVGAHLRRQLSYDLWYIAIGLFILAITEGSRLMANDFTMFAVLFEIISAYGTVGMSLGYSTVNASLCSQFSIVGKLVIIAMMIRGRHRGLPYGLDRAIMLPSETLIARETADADARMARQISHASLATGVGAARRRRSSLSGGRAGMLVTSLLHPGPARPAAVQLHDDGLRRRNTAPNLDDEDLTLPTRTMSAVPHLGSSREPATPRPRSAHTIAL
ncbi:hypothetical protein OQA88_7617 [Cercophora sp. LCS_1]